MANLKTRWLGLNLPHPLIAGSSPLADTVDGARRLEDAGAAAIVLRSLFEEQVDARASDGEDFALTPDEYVAHVGRVKQALKIPVIASLNGTTPGPWLEKAKDFEAAGADAIELNLYAIATEPWDPPQVIERRTVGIVRAVRSMVKIPLGVKLSPFYTSLPYMANEFEGAGADGIVLFNRFYQPDVDLEKGAVSRSTRLSDPGELLPRLHAAAILAGRIKAGLCVTGGVHSAVDALKAIACGAHAVQMVSALLQDGVAQLGRVRADMDAWLDRRGIATLENFRGSLSLLRCPDPRAWVRLNYVKLLRGHELDYVSGRG